MMAGEIRLFEVDANGLLHEVPPDQAAQRRAERDCSHVNIVIDVLLTDAELAQRQADAAAAASAAAAAQKAASNRAAERIVALDKLAQLGLTAEDVDALLRG